MKPRKVDDSRNQTLALGAGVGVACLALALSIIFIIGSGKGQKASRGIAAQTSGTVQPKGTSSAAQTTLTIEQVEVPPLSCLLYTSDAADDLLCVDLGGRRIIK